MFLYSSGEIKYSPSVTNRGVIVIFNNDLLYNSGFIVKFVFLVTFLFALFFHFNSKDQIFLY